MNAITMIEPDEVHEAQPVAVPALASATSPHALLAMAVQKGATLEQLERFMALVERHDANEARKAFVSAMADFKTEPLTIFKNKQVGYTTKDGDFVGYKHAELSDVTDVVGPAMARHGLSYRWDIKQESGRINVTCIITHKLGHSESVTMDAAPDASGKKNAIQQIASSVSYLQRYTLLSATGMSTKGVDDDGAGAGDADAEDPLLAGFRDASLNGEAALRAHYDKYTPAESFWLKHGPALKKAAKAADAGVAQ